MTVFCVLHILLLCSCSRIKPSVFGSHCDVSSRSHAEFMLPDDNPIVNLLNYPTHVQFGLPVFLVFIELLLFSIGIDVFHGSNFLDLFQILLPCWMVWREVVYTHEDLYIILMFILMTLNWIMIMCLCDETILDLLRGLYFMMGLQVVADNLMCIVV